jgi:hypothetical protein
MSLVGTVSHSPPYDGSSNDASDAAGRRTLQGYLHEKRHDKTAPCAPALFISPSACSAFATPACPPAQLNPSSGSMEMRASTLLVKSPDLTVPNRAKLSDHQDKRFDRDGILISARAEVGQH